MDEKIKKGMAKFMKGLSKEELLLLNKMAIAQVRELNRIKGLEEQKKYQVGDHVEFDSKKRNPFGETLRGDVVSVNSKTLTVLTITSGKWRVHYDYIRKAA